VGLDRRAGEQAVLAAKAGAVARFSLLYGLPECPRETSLARFVRAVEAGELVPARVDEYRTPVALADAARIVVELGRLDHHGLLHVAGPDALTAHDMLTALARAAGVAPRLAPVSRTTLSAEIVRPRNVAMDGGALATLLPHAAPRAISATTPATRPRAPERPPSPWPARVAAPARAAAPLAS
jgi:dTDP-4-dehydrorhamnose reductase